MLGASEKEGRSGQLRQSTLPLQSKKGPGRAKTRLKRALSRSGKENAGIASVQAGPERAQARLENACSVAKGPTSH